MSSAKKQGNDYEIVTDQLDDDEEKQSEEKKLAVAQRVEAAVSQPKLAAPQKSAPSAPAASVAENDEQKK